MEGKRGSECLLKPVSNIDFNPNQVNDYLKDNNLKGSGLFSRAVRYLDEDDYKKEELYKENNITNINGVFIVKGSLKM